MGRLSKGHIAETVLWLGFAAFLYYFSFEFDRPIEIYKFGASAWPRAVILLIVIAALGNFYYHWRFGDEVESGVIGGSAFADAMESAEPSDGNEESAYNYYIRIGAMLALPFVYAYFLESIGFYSLTPVFIVAVIVLMGERRIMWILGVTAVTYIVLLLLFVKIFYTGLPPGTIHPFYDFSNWLLAIFQSSWLGL